MPCLGSAAFAALLVLHLITFSTVLESQTINLDVASRKASMLPYCRLEKKSKGAVLRYGGLLELHDHYFTPTQQCSFFSGWAAVQQSAAYNFILQNGLKYTMLDGNSQINEMLLNANVTNSAVSSLAFDACGSGQLAVEQALILASDSNTFRNQSLDFLLQFIPGGCSSLSSSLDQTSPLLAVIGPMTSATVTAVSPFLSNYQIPHVTYWASSTLFDDLDQYNFLLRTVPSDAFQAVAIADLIEHFGWEYVSLIAAEDDVYSGRGYELIRAEASTRGTFCLAVESRFRGRGDFAMAQMNALIDALNESPATVIILYAPVSAAAIFLDLYNSRGSRDKIFIGSHDWINRISFPPNSFQTRVPIIGLGPRTIASSSTHEAVNDFRQAMANSTYVRLAVRSDPWLRLYVEQQLQCHVSTNGCSVRPPGSLNRTRLCQDSDFDRFQPRSSMVIAESLILGILASWLSIYNQLRPDDFVNNRVGSSGVQILHDLLNMTMLCHNFTRRCTVFEKQHTFPSYYVQNIQLTSAGFYDVISIGNWEHGRGFMWNQDEMLDLGTFGKFSPSPSNLTYYRAENVHLPTSNCSFTCAPGQRRVFDENLPLLCCWTCADCTGATFSNTTNADACMSCPLGYGSDGVACSPLRPQQHSIVDIESLIILCVAGIGFILTLGTLIYFHAHPKAPLVRASDLTLSTISMVAMVVGHALVPLILIPGTVTTTFCTLSAVLPEPIKTIVVCAVLVKTKRFNSVFKSMTVLSQHKRRRVLLGTPMQVSIVLLLTLVDLLFVLLYAFVDPPSAMTAVSISKVELYCELHTVWVGILSAYTLLLLLVCIILAFLTRKLPEAYNESQLLYLASVTGFVVWLGLFPAQLVTGRELRPLISAMSLEVHIYAFWVCLYAPRMIQMLLYKKYRMPTTRTGTAMVRLTTGGTKSSGSLVETEVASASKSSSSPSLTSEKETFVKANGATTEYVSSTITCSAVVCAADTGTGSYEDSVPVNSQDSEYV